MTTIDGRSSNTDLLKEIDRIRGVISRPPTTLILDRRLNWLMKLPIKQLLRYLTLTKAELPICYWIDRLRSVVPRAITPNWIVDWRYYYLQKSNQIEGIPYLRSCSLLASIEGRDNEEIGIFSQPVKGIMATADHFYFRESKKNILYRRELGDEEKIDDSGIEKIFSIPHGKAILINGRIMLRGRVPGRTELTDAKTGVERGSIFEISLSLTHLLVLAKDDQGAILGYVLGDNKHQQLPFDATALPRLTPLNLPKGTLQLVAGQSRSYALTGSGQLFVMGRKDQVLGSDGERDKDGWQLIPHHCPIIKVVVGGNHTLFLDLEGAVWGWGRFSCREFGELRQQPSAYPKKLFDQTRVVDIDTGRWKTAILTQNHDLYIYGAAAVSKSPNGGMRVQAMLEPIIVHNVKLAKTNDCGVVYLKV